MLLRKILENTLPDASAYPVLQRAASALQDVNANINEYKMRKEVGKDLEHLGDAPVRMQNKKKNNPSQTDFTNKENVTACINSEVMWALGRD